MDTSYLAEAVQDGLQREDPSFGTITLRHHTLGELVLTSGNVVACDPLVMPDAKPFAAQVPPGRYPVVVNVATFANDNDQRVAYAILKFSDRPVLRWEMATCEGQDINELAEDEIFCYPVDAGIGCFMDTEAGQLVAQESSGDIYFSDLLLEALDNTRLDTWCWANMSLDDATGTNMIAFSSGWGDGCYASYCGYDSDNQIVCLVTDFDVLDHPGFSEEEEAEEE